MLKCRCIHKKLRSPAKLTSKNAVVDLKNVAKSSRSLCTISNWSITSLTSAPIADNSISFNIAKSPTVRTFLLWNVTNNSSESVQLSAKLYGQSIKSGKIASYFLTFSVVSERLDSKMTRSSLLSSSSVTAVVRGLGDSSLMKILLFVVQGSLKLTRFR